MSCGLTSCPNFPHPDGSAVATSGYLQVVPSDEFEREELQSIRDRARRLSIQSSLAKTVEERLYQELADVADQLDAFAARFEADVEEMESNVTELPTVPYDSCSPTHRHSGHRHQPFLGGHRKS